MATSVPSTDPACDQCRLKKVRCGREQPECVNCRRNGISCTFSERGKKSNQMSQVIRSLKEMKSRLDEIDHTMLQVKIVVGDATTKPMSIDHNASWVAMHMTDSVNDPTNINAVCDQTLQPTRHHLVNDQHYGTSSLASLFSEIETLLEARLAGDKDSHGGYRSPSSNEEARECQLALHNITKTMRYHDSLELPDEDLPPALPPKDVLEAAIEPYFSQVNSLLPVFRKDAFCENVQRIYSADPYQADIAWILCFNNVILQSLSPDSVPIIDQSEDSSVTLGESPEKELLQPLLANYRRGLSKLNRLLEPRLMNVQALLSMCIIAQENCHYRLASLLLHQACFVAKSMGLHQQNAISLEQNAEKMIECNHAFWVLYIVDKSISLTMGQSCCLPMYDCDVSIPNHDPSNHFHEHFIARVELAAMQEDSYQILYSSQARRRGDFGRTSGVSQLDHKLSLEASRHGELRNDAQNENGVSSPTHSLQSFASTVLEYHFYLTGVLVHQSVKRTSNKRRCCRDSRQCIRLLQRLSTDCGPHACAHISRQIHGDQPLIPFFVLFCNVIREPQNEQSMQDVQLMAATVNTLKHSQRFDSSRDCVAQLQLCSKAITAFLSKNTSPATSIPVASMIPATTDSKPLRINTDPFHTYTERAGRKRNKLNDGSRTSSWTNIPASARSHLSATDHAATSEQDLSRTESWFYAFANPPDLITSGSSLGFDTDSPSSLTMGRTGLELTGSQVDEPQQQQFEQSQLNFALSEDCGGYAMAVPPQLGARLPMEFGPGYFGEDFVPRRTEQWLI